MQIQPYQLEELNFAWCHRVYYRWRTHRRQPHPAFAHLDRDVLCQLLQPYGIHVLDVTTDEIDLRTLVSLQPTETVSAAAGKMKGRISKWLGEQSQRSQATKSLGRGYFAATTGQSTATAVEEYLERQAEHHGYSNRVRVPVFVRQFERTEESQRILQTDHAVTVLRYHVVLATWRRQGVFGRSSAEAVCGGWRILQADLRMVIDKVSFLPDHVHVALALHPNRSPGEIVVAMMNAAQDKMWDAFADDVVKAGVERLWQASAYVGSFGDLSSNAISGYLERWERG
ncbi:MAG: IS200/IS605 family transposase [Candidatus Anammoximicrobium sp.]|nr:IS200/IS605 family transposase [Candidatus Anammoximicrobium sp.]